MRDVQVKYSYVKRKRELQGTRRVLLAMRLRDRFGFCGIITIEHFDAVSRSEERRVGKECRL